MDLADARVDGGESASAAASSRLRVMEDPETGVCVWRRTCPLPPPSPASPRPAPLRPSRYVHGLSSHRVFSADQVLQLIEDGNRWRAIAATNMNNSSSRSHAVFQLLLKQEQRASDGHTIRKSSKVYLGAAGATPRRRRG